MDCSKVGYIIYTLRREKKMTQKQLAEAMNISDKTVSKWERGLGCPDVSVLAELSEILGVGLEDMLRGELSANTFVGGNMKKSKFYVCPDCGNVTVCTGNAAVTCCGRKLEPLTPVKAEPQQKLKTEVIENEWFISSDHPMTKENYISFVAFLTGDRLQLIKQYPEWELQTRIHKREHGTLLWYCINDGLYYQYL